MVDDFSHKLGEKDVVAEPRPDYNMSVIGMMVKNWYGRVRLEAPSGNWHPNVVKTVSFCTLPFVILPGHLTLKAQTVGPEMCRILKPLFDDYLTWPGSFSKETF